MLMRFSSQGTNNKAAHAREHHECAKGQQSFAQFASLGFFRGCTSELSSVSITTATTSSITTDAHRKLTRALVIGAGLVQQPC